MIRHVKSSSPFKKKGKVRSTVPSEVRERNSCFSENIKSAGHQYLLISLVKVRKLVLDLN
ncbi:hypothetical protein DRO38_01540 [Candidatus Bathyarchaeota archaeon]|nr:MAG: hypothetical protein DRO38_01540 [Candidatus Bathyarchaeota archaeon]